MRKQLATVALTTLVSLTASMPAFAGQWLSDANGWWWQNDDGSYPANTWQWIDGNGDGVSESYYFNEQGYCLMNTTTPDGYTVSPAGAWIIDGIVQTKQSSVSTFQPDNTNVTPVNLLDLTETDSSLCWKFENERTKQGQLWAKGYRFLTSSTCYIEFKAGKQYTSFTATIAPAKEGTWAKTDYTVEVYGDNDTLLYSEDFSRGSDSINMEADITGQERVKIVVDADCAAYALMKDAQFK